MFSTSAQGRGLFVANGWEWVGRRLESYVVGRQTYGPGILELAWNAECTFSNSAIFSALVI